MTSLENKAQLVDMLVLSDALEEITVYYLKDLLKENMCDLKRWHKDKENFFMFEHNKALYRDTLTHCRNLVEVLSALTLDDYSDTLKKLKKYTKETKEQLS